MSDSHRPGFTILESLIALSVLAIASVLVAQVGTTALMERARLTETQALLETANNVLETARALRFDQLTPEWAAAQQLPESWRERQPAVQLTVRVEPLPEKPWAKRVSVGIDRLEVAGEPVRIAELDAVFVDRKLPETRP